jgi:hypothetical protein
VAVGKDGIIDCAEGARITLFHNSQKLGDVLTDNYGDFKFDKLDENSGRYYLEVEYKNYGKKNIEVNLDMSKSVGTILF